MSGRETPSESTTATSPDTLLPKNPKDLNFRVMSPPGSATYRRSFFYESSSSRGKFSFAEMGQVWWAPKFDSE
jgi:hypothetical protein